MHPEGAKIDSRIDDKHSAPLGQGHLAGLFATNILAPPGPRKVHG
jgi:hypothetical protein